MIKLIIFDLDGPILDSFEAAQESIALAREKLHLPVPTKEVITTSWGYPGKLALNKIFPALATIEIETLMNTWAANERSREIKLVLGASETLTLLRKKNYYMGILTSRSLHLAARLAELDLNSLFDFMQSWESPNMKEKQPIYQNHIFSPYHKPDPNVFQNVFNWSKGKGVNREEMMLIDDTLVGLEAARSVGISFAGVCTGPLNSQAKWLHYGNLDGKYVINSIAELPKWLEEHSGM